MDDTTLIQLPQPSYEELEQLADERDSLEILLAQVLQELAQKFGKRAATEAVISAVSFMHTVVDGARPTAKRVPWRLREAIHQRDGGACLHCGSKEFLVIDHIVPQSLGGTTEPENLQLLCRSCNGAKGNRV